MSKEEIIEDINNYLNEPKRSRPQHHQHEDVFKITSRYAYIIRKYLIEKMHNDVDKMIESEKDKTIKKQLMIIDNLINNYNLLYRMKEELKIELFDDIDLTTYDDRYKEYVDNKSISINHSQLRTREFVSIVDDEFLFNTYQCYFKSAINFFANNKYFIRQFIKNKPKDVLNLDDIIVEGKKSRYSNEESLSDMILTESQKGGNFYDVFLSYFTQNDNPTKALTSIKNFINSHYNNKYILGIPGFKIMPAFIIQDILMMLKDDFTKSCMFKLEKSSSGLIYDICYHNTFYDDEYGYEPYNNPFIDSCIEALRHNNTNFKDYVSYETVKKRRKGYLSKEAFDYAVGVYRFETTIFTFHLKDLIRHNFDILPTNFLFHCPMYDTHEFLMINHIVPFNYYHNTIIDYNKLKETIKDIKKEYKVSCIYPLNMTIQDTKYYLHSFILCIANDTMDSHFVYHKIEKDDIVIFDVKKERHTLKSFELFKDDAIVDNNDIKVVFCCYRKVE